MIFAHSIGKQNCQMDARGRRGALAFRDASAVAQVLARGAAVRRSRTRAISLIGSGTSLSHKIRACDDGDILMPHIRGSADIPPHPATDWPDGTASGYRGPSAFGIACTTRPAS
jgi:hypothetical protein